MMRKARNGVLIGLSMLAVFGIGFGVVWFIIAVIMDDDGYDVLEDCNGVPSSVTKVDPNYNPRLDYNKDGIICE